jgi:hypothetical protein
MKTIAKEITLTAALLFGGLAAPTPRAHAQAGVPLWTNYYSGPGNGDDKAAATLVDGSGNVFVTGYSAGSRGDSDYATIKYSSAGVPLWTNRYDGPANDDDFAKALVADTARFIAMYEPPAFWYENYYHWHYAHGPATITPQQLEEDGQRFISPILFIDGHSASHDFTHALKDDPNYPMEPTKDWMWYKPKE